MFSVSISSSGLIDIVLPVVASLSNSRLSAAAPIIILFTIEPAGFIFATKTPALNVTIASVSID